MIGGAQLDGTNSKKPDVINYVFNEMQIHPDSHRIIMIGDRSHDVHGAQHHGIPVVGVEWGYADPGELEAAGADFVVGSVAELRAILLGE
jgi:phosphoglycolate phosphatase